MIYVSHLAAAFLSRSNLTIFTTQQNVNDIQPDRDGTFQIVYAKYFVRNKKNLENEKED